MKLRTGKFIADYRNEDCDAGIVRKARGYVVCSSLRRNIKKQLAKAWRVDGQREIKQSLMSDFA